MTSLGTVGLVELRCYAASHISSEVSELKYSKRSPRRWGKDKESLHNSMFLDAGSCHVCTESSRANSRIRSSLRGRSRSSVGRLTGLGITISSTSISSSGQKRKRDERSAPEIGTIKRSKSDDSQMVTANPEPDVKEHELDNFNVHSIEEPEADSLAGCESETYGNRIHCCLVVSLAGRPLHAYRSVKELLEALLKYFRVLMSKIKKEKNVRVL